MERDTYFFFFFFFFNIEWFSSFLTIPYFPLQEEEIKEIKKQEVGVDISVDTKHQTMAGISFPVVPDALQAITNFTKGKLQYVQLKIGELYCVITIKLFDI